MKLLFAYIGSILGSFMGLMSYRLPLNVDIIKDRSKCESCGKLLRPIELIPIFSYIRQRGRCRICKEPIRIINFLIEIVNGLIFLIYIKYYDVNIVSFISLLCLDLLIVMSLIDIGYKIIPNIISLSLLTLSIGKSILVGRFLPRLISTIIFIGFIVLVYLLSRKSIGMGDIKIFLGLGFFWSGDMFILNIFLSVLIGSLYSILMIATGRLNIKDKIAFGPFILIGYLMTLTLGGYILDIYKLYFF